MSKSAWVDVREGSPLQALPLVTLYLTDRCNSRCITCDYWRHGRTNLSLKRLNAMLPSLSRLHTETALLSGGEPLMNPEWPQMAEALRNQGLKLWLLTSGLSLAKHAKRVASLFDAVTVSLDGTDSDTYARIRGLDAFETVCSGIRAAGAAGASVNLRVTLQRANYLQMPRFVALARELGVQQISFLAVDVSNAHAFARDGDIGGGIALVADDLGRFRTILSDLERSHESDFRSKFIAESPGRLMTILQYFAALCGQAEFPAVKCNVPEFSAVITAAVRMQPCFFIPGPNQPATGEGVEGMLNSPEMREIRRSIAAGERQECKRCVCSMWRSPDSRGSGALLASGRALN